MKQKILLFIFMLLLVFNVTSVYAKTKSMEVKDLKITSKSSTVTVDEPKLVNDAITSKIQFNEVGDFVTYELTLKNNEKEKYKIDKVSDTNVNDNIKIEYEYSDEFVEPGESTILKIKVSYDKQLLNVEKVNINDVSMTLDLVDEKGSKKQSVLNPKTGDSILKYIILALVAVLGLVAIIFGKKIKGSRVGYLLVISALAMLPISAFAIEKLNLKISFGEIEVKGKFEEYSIAVTNPDGTVEDRKVTYGQKMGTLPTAPEKSGYRFVKYTDEAGNEVTSETIVKGPIKLVPVYEEKVVLYTFDPNGGSVNVESLKVNEGEKSVGLPTPYKEGYVFDGWYTAKTGGSVVTSQTVASADQTLFARFIKSDNLISYTDQNDDYEISEGDTVKIGNDEFIVIDTVGKNVRLMAKYNLDANARQAAGTKFGVKFADSYYWGDESCQTILTHGTEQDVCSYTLDSSYPSINSYSYVSGLYVQNPSVGTSSSSYNELGVSENNATDYLTAYVEHLSFDLGVEDIYGIRLPSYEEINDMSSFANGQSFWTGSAHENSKIWYYDVVGNSNSTEYNGSEIGIRPVIEVKISLITD